MPVALYTILFASPSAPRLALAVLLVGAGIGVTVGVLHQRRAARAREAASDGRADPSAAGNVTSSTDAAARGVDGTAATRPVVAAAITAAAGQGSPPTSALTVRHRMTEVLADATDDTAITNRLSSAAIRHFGNALEPSRRRQTAEARVADELHVLAFDAWLVERNVWIDNEQIPFVLVGPTGLFLLAATDAEWDVGDAVRLARLRTPIRERMPGYRGRVHVGVCLAFDDMPPRAWYGGQAADDGLGGWVLGANWLLRWLDGLQTKQRIAVEDIQALDAAAGPHWSRRTRARLPEVQNFG